MDDEQQYKKVMRVGLKRGQPSHYQAMQVLLNHAQEIEGFYLGSVTGLEGYFIEKVIRDEK